MNEFNGQANVNKWQMNECKRQMNVNRRQKNVKHFRGNECRRQMNEISVKWTYVILYWRQMKVGARQMNESTFFYSSNERNYISHRFKQVSNERK